jgi:hypothetical protein
MTCVLLLLFSLYFLWMGSHPFLFNLHDFSSYKMNSQFTITLPGHLQNARSNENYVVAMF